jgi:mannose-6-phosphate isomerase-like protein (cupin superfamily)
MSLKPKEDIGEETHDDVDQFFRFKEGDGVVVIDGTRHTMKDGSGVIVPSGAKHNVITTSNTKNLRLSTISSTASICHFVVYPGFTELTRAMGWLCSLQVSFFFASHGSRGIVENEILP